MTPFVARRDDGRREPLLCPQTVIGKPELVTPALQVDDQGGHDALDACVMKRWDRQQRIGGEEDDQGVRHGIIRPGPSFRRLPACQPSARATLSTSALSWRSQQNILFAAS
jgi:hypothetical protein